MPACQNQGVAQLPAIATTPIRGSITVRDRIDNTVDATGKPINATTGLVVGDFGDYSAITSTPSALMDLGEGCVGVVSRPLRMGMVKPLTLGSLSIKGTAKGEVLTTSSTTGVYALSSSAPLLRGVPSIEVVGTMGGFPSFDKSIDSVAPMEVSFPASDGTADLKDAMMTIDWTKNDSTYVQIQVLPNSKDTKVSMGGQVACFVPDNGCFNFPHAAATFLLASRASTYTLSVERHRHTSASIDSRTDLEIETIAEWRLTLKNGVLAP